MTQQPCLRADGHDTPRRVTELDKLQNKNADMLCSLLSEWGPNSVRLRVASEATDLGLYARAQRAAKSEDLLVTAERHGMQCSARWSDNRIWDPGD